MKAFTFFLLLSLAALSSARVFQDHVTCGHRHFKEEIITGKVDEQPLNPGGRVLATASYPNIRITPDYSLLVNGTAAFRNYVQFQLMPPILDYFKAALAVKQPLTSPLKLPPSNTQICGYKTPQPLLSGVTTDFYLIVASVTDNANNFVASAGSCYLSSGNNRPLIGRMLFNLVYTTDATGDILAHEQNTYLTIHEMFHAFGFTGSNFLTFIDGNGKTIANPIKNVTIGGVTRSFLDIEPLTSNLRAYTGCSSLPGAMLEDDGGAGTAGSHFERRAFLYEVMTSGVMDGYRVSNFSFNVLEASGWYVPNYTYAEPFYFGKGEGCNFLYQDCSQSTFNFADFCKSNGPSRGCTANGRGGGVCAFDSRSDNCYYMFPMRDYDCNNAEAADNARLASQETYGRGLGSKCFTGTLTTLSKGSQTSFCFKYTCSGSGLNTVVNVNVGSQTITCKAEGQTSVKGYNGVFNCPDPQSFCNGQGKQFCPRNCMGRGTCVDNKCNCNSGTSGLDCGVVGTWGK